MRPLLLVTAILILGLLCPAVSRATPEFSRRNLLSCNACHAVGSSLNDFGRAFKANGNRIPRLLPLGDVPLLVRGQSVYTSDPDPTGLPKWILDEVEALSSAPIGKNLSYGTEFYSLDGGRPGLTREAWLEYRTSDRQAIPFGIRAGLQILPLPLDPERFRESNQHYLAFDQTVGNNTFNFFDPHNAVRFEFGRDAGGIGASVLAVSGHDQQSPLPGDNLDQMVQVQDAHDHSLFTAYRYQGRRSTGGTDTFWRDGFSAGYYVSRLWLDAAVQTGNDSNPLGTGAAVLSSGGYLQARYQVGRHAFAVVRYDSITDTVNGASRSFTAGGGFSFARSFRLEIENVTSHQPQTHNTLSVLLGFGAGTMREGSFAY